MADRDYTRIVESAPPEGLLPRLEEKGVWTENWLVYRAGKWVEPMTGIAEKCVDAVCTACGHHMKLGYAAGPACSSWAPAPFGFGLWEPEYKAYISGDSLLCPECGAKVKALHIGGVGYGMAQYVFPVTFGRTQAEEDGKPDRLILQCWRVGRIVRKDGSTYIEKVPWEAYVIEDRKIIRLAHWQAQMYGRISINYAWRQNVTFRATLRDIDLVYCPEGIGEAIKGTTAENSKLDLYMALDTTRYPVDFLRIWQKHRNAETLLTAGAGKALGELIDGEKRRGIENPNRWDANNRIPKLEALDWKAKRPSEILRMNRGQLREFVRNGYGAKELTGWLLARKYGAECRIPEDIPAIRSITEHDMERIARSRGNYTLSIRYITAQKRKYPKDNVTVVELCDYWDILRGQGNELREHDVKWPQRLKTAHDQAVAHQKFKEKPEWMPMFRERHEKLMKFAWEKDGIRIFPPERENDLIEEGKALHHCVANYAARHAKGETTILFVRRTEAPDVPWYTLNLNEATLNVIQNRGLRNCERVPEVREFEDAWIEWVRAGCKRESKKKERIA